jgi:GDP-L-fucose synthase
MKINLPSYRIGITGGAGFLGKSLCAQLRQIGCDQLIIPRRAEYDFTNQEAVKQWYHDEKPDIVFHLAAEVGGIGANRAMPGRFFYANAAMGINLIEEARVSGVKKFIQAGTICAYPKFSPIPFSEENLWDGYPEETNAPYGIAKKALLVMLQAYRQQYQFDGIYLLPVNLYGPEDNFDVESSHVIPALIRKCIEAKNEDKPYITCWGTGNATREFLYVDDCARALIMAAENYSSDKPVNIGSNREISIKDLITLIAELCAYHGEIRWDASKPDGQPRRCLDVRKARDSFGFAAQMDFREGLKKTIAWYQQQHPSL